MAYPVPTLRTLIDRCVADINSRLTGADARLSGSVLNVLAFIVAACVNGLYGFIAWLSRQFLPDTAEGEWLERLATIWLRDGRIAAVPATGIITVTGSTGTMPAGTLWRRVDGVQYQTTGVATLLSGVATVGVVAVEAGAGGNLSGGALSLVSPLAGFDNNANLVGELSGGADEEKDDALRARVLYRIRNTPQGGSATDYVRWALEVAGVTAAWVQPGALGAGTVVVRFVRGNDASIIPDAGEVATVQAYIDARRPVTAAVTVAAPVAVPLNLTIDLLPDSSDVRTAVIAELTDLLQREAVPGGTILLSHIRAAISNAAGETDYTMTVPSADVTHAAGQLPVLGTITWL